MSASCGDCCGTTAALTSAPALGRTDAPLLAGIHLTEAPERACGCRAQDPAAPRPDKESRPHEERHDEARADSSPFALAPSRPAPPKAHLVAIAVSPPKSPLYLRISRLLI